MCAKWAKAPFSIILLTEILKHLYLEIGVPRAKMYRVEDHGGYRGYFLEAAMKLKSIVSKKILDQELHLKLARSNV